MDDTPLFDQTLGSVLVRMRAQARLEAQAELAAALARQEQELERVRREYDLRQALAAQQAEHLARQRAVPPPEEVEEPTAPPVPPFADLLTSSKRLDSFFDALLGP